MLRLIVLLMALMFAAPAARADAETVRDRIVSVLREDGYSEIRISRTLLGRMRFVGSRTDARREIVVNPSSGVVLRDYVRFLNRSPSGSSNSGSSGNYDDDDYDDDYGDDDDHDDDDEDNSGSGSSNSGSGSSNSGSGNGDDDDD